MYQSDSPVMSRNVDSTRVVRKPALNQVTFSGTGGASCVHGKMCPLPSSTLITSRSSASGRKAT